MEKKTEKVEVASEAVVEKTVAEKIWTEIKDLPIDMFSLPGQVVSQYCKVVSIEPSKCFVTITASAALPALEAALPSIKVPSGTKLPDLKPKYIVEKVDKFVTIAYSKEFLTYGNGQ